jgi:pimeloyl-ACP methyl ester carboxylesterase
MAFRFAQASSPRFAARLADRLFCTPPRTPVSPAALEFLRTARRTELSAGGRRVVVWRWGREDRTAVMLVHGWGGRGGRMRAFVPPLLDAGYSVLAFDAPGHGASGHGLSSMPDFARAALTVAESAGPVQGVIAHSMGGSATALAMGWGLGARRLAFVAPSANPASFSTGFAAALGLRPDVVRLMRERMERRLRFSWDDVDVPTMARRMDVPLLIVHDRSDPTVPWADGAAIAAAWPGAQLLSTEGLGHQDVVRDPQVVRTIVDFVLDVDVTPQQRLGAVVGR